MIGTRLFQWNESGRSVTGSTVSDRSVSDGELTQVVANHLWLDLNGVENLTVVDTNQRTNHFWNNNHVSQVGLDNSRLLVSWSSQLSSSQLGNQTHWLGAQTSGESSSDSSTTELGEFFSLQLQQFLEVNTLEGESLESSLSLVSSLSHGCIWFVLVKNIQSSFFLW
ncbi:hypothetical protein CLUG_03016 [Clavispora lusitaniae ATCC 42720]|uniref:Uncharacterized protein n=1 Tax=Clavispora lusitaniae (strain ATCC 42720) TaxID=306902 RepID=C4Y3A3_CLAL4|nr:uncharacterized protein CLUG_03016 [Clavispora lusitaniae ATCC 42720]EEQ38890.1 hypothetical protein CLUG_03016 [Clavispora lusitaniae ATCC 42720]